MTRQALFFLTAAAASLAVCSLVACNGASDDFSTGNQRSIDADINATHDQGPTAENQGMNTNTNSDEIAERPSVTVPFHRDY
jgi:hypothetical protein